MIRRWLVISSSVFVVLVIFLAVVSISSLQYSSNAGSCDGNQCVRTATLENFTAVSSSNNSDTHKEIIHIVVSVDLSVLDGLVAMVQSVIEHTGNSDIRIHIVVKSTNRRKIEKRLNCSVSIPDSVKILYKVFDHMPKNFVSLIKVNYGRAKYLSNPANFARFFFGHLFPELSHILYLDVDLVVQHNISELWKEIVGHTHLLTVVHRQNKACSDLFSSTIMMKLYYKRYHKSLNEMDCESFNAGVVGFNLDKWREKKIFDEVKYWMGENSKKKLWKLGTQPILYAVSINDVKVIPDEQWNLVLGLGSHSPIPVEKVEGYIIHWNGMDKPWGTRLNLHSRKKIKRKKLTELYDKFWKVFDRKVCSGNGTCVSRTDMKLVQCVCDKGYGGEHCQNHLK